MSKIVNKLCPECLRDIYQKDAIFPNIGRTINNRDLHIPKVNQEDSEKCFQCFGIKIWSEISVEIRELSSLTAFKKNLKEYLLSNRNS